MTRSVRLARGLLATPAHPCFESCLRESAEQVSEYLKLFIVPSG